MCSIAAIYRSLSRQGGVLSAACDDAAAIARMNRTMAHRGPDDNGIFQDDTVCLAHNRLSVMDPARGRQPMTIVYKNRHYTIVYNGEIYNTDALKNELSRSGAVFSTECDTEVVLWSYILWGRSCPTRLNGIFAFLVYDHAERTLFAVRDRLGVKPLYYARTDGEWYFASEPKALLAHPKIHPTVNREGLWELLFLSPVTTEESAIFRDIRQLRAGEWMMLSPDGVETAKYWQLHAAACTDSMPDAVANTRYLLDDAVHRQLRSDVPLCTFLSGGLDSSVLTAIAARHLVQEGKQLSTYSFEYEGNAENFTASLFQPQGDDLYARRLAMDLGTDHTVLTIPTDAVADLLDEASIYRDLPGQADIDSSLLWYCRQVKKRHTVAISGECSDEIFGGYPWFYRPEMLSRDFFPWLHDPYARIKLFRADILRPAEGFAHLSKHYKDFLASCPILEGESDEDRRARIATCLSVRYFMQNLLARKDRMSMASAVEVRVPFADHRILEYLYNLPWQYKFRDGVEKSLLRDAASDLLPDYILHRKKSPYPKTHNPAYEQRIRAKLTEKLQEDTLFTALIDRKAVQSFIDGENTTWFGQLMARPQMIAWLLQLSAWLEHYPVEISL
ncbi:MAG: asparagine synthase (glutamine-hydrolyzing) [Clostridia bacterium]|nr:asparagine synthase (glutamine-hydrolyzing) [Clostridia bacterium]